MMPGWFLTITHHKTMVVPAGERRERLGAVEFEQVLLSASETVGEYDENMCECKGDAKLLEDDQHECESCLVHLVDDVACGGAVGWKWVKGMGEGGW